MLKILPLLIIFFVPKVFPHDGGVAVGNGGDVVMCQGETSYVSLDYLLAREEFGYDVKLVKTKGLEASLNRIYSMLVQKLPSLAPSFKEYRTQILNTDPSKRYLWKARNWIDDVDDEDAKRLPWHCHNWNGSMHGRQIIVRKALPSGQVVFEYDRSLYNEMKNSSRQLSFILVHEWLWNHTSRASHNRRVNYFLHANFMEQLSSQEVQERVLDYGLILN